MPSHALPRQANPRTHANGRSLVWNAASFDHYLSSKLGAVHVSPSFLPIPSLLFP